MSNEPTRLTVNAAFIVEHSALVKRIAYYLLGRLPASIQCEDLIQSGMIGLIEAANKFDNSKGVKFTTYAGIRIRGAMLDEVRKGDWAPRSVHRNSRMIAKAMRVIEHETGNVAKDADVANYLNLSLTEYYEILNDTNITKILSFEELSLNNNFLGFYKDERQEDVVEKIAQEVLKENMTHEIDKLPKRERLVFTLYYDGDFNLREIGEVLGVSESRASQLHGQGILRLKKGKLNNWKKVV